MKQRVLAFNDLFSIQWHITDKCALDCFHCYRKEKKQDLDFKSLLFIFDRIQEFLKKNLIKGRIHFAGGEPLISPYIFQLLKKATDSGMKSRILSSGTVIDEHKAKELAISGGKYVQISLEGTEITNDEIRGIGSYAKAINGAKILSENDIEVTLAMVLSKKNLVEIENLRNIGEGLAKRVYFSRLVPIKDFHHDYLINASEWEKAMETIMKLRGVEIPYRDPTFRPFFLSPWKANNVPAIAGCSIGYNSIAIESNGDVYLCRRLPIVIGNVLENSLIDIWKSPMLQEIRNRDNLKGKCRVCSYKWLCGGCRGIAYALKGDYLEEDPQCPHSIYKIHHLASYLPAGKKKL